ncbi:uncharacterized protein L969DRAFT_85061 [Mixia osmundae IAM 14324]|uniref:Nitrogen permease regulator 3 n=1 Tax=Mixia osmundae (strain CBS 9802 / IAM 14324 / JCM 22182 / KY 12970) TaxID=764103 RepID=G7DXA9_MIXOS|nr:uncharacterized protein L969DRAFT_85061 [Mixia osmundae IAM 14324]KEI41287.1 hypothetical protein L969DRAFT_85061 [Mixia osmundae IAM 14324]GAA95219.1 hypothetical protein E5Q_01875 [Mixia osmundae IAM 14324]
MATLLAIILVCSSASSGTTFVFGWPPKPQAIPRLSRPIYRKSAEIKDVQLRCRGSDSDTSSEDGLGLRYLRGEQGSSDEEDAEEMTPALAARQANAYHHDKSAPSFDEYLGLPTTLLASLLMPDKELCNQKLELVVDAKSFIGHPVWLSSASSAPKSDAQRRSDIKTHDFAADAATNEAAQPSTRSRRGIEAFHLVLVIDTPSDRHLSRHLDVYYQSVAVKLTAALKYVEKRSGYVTNAIRNIVRDRENALEKGTSYAQYMEDISKSSGLCQQLVTLYAALKAEPEPAVAKLTFDDHLDMSVQLNTILLDRNMYADAEAGNLKRSAIPDALCQPWQTALPLEEPANIAKQLDQNDGVLQRFLSVMTPSLSISEIQMALDLNSTTVRKIVGHLVRWNKARVIETVSLRHVYGPAPTLQPRKLALLSSQFRRHFDEPPLAILLHHLAPSVTFAIVLSGLAEKGYMIDKATGLQMLIWLLQNNIAIQHTETYRLLVTPETKWAASAAVAREHSRPDNRATLSPEADIGHELAVPLSASSDGKLSPFRQVSSEQLRRLWNISKKPSLDATATLIADPVRPTEQEKTWIAQIGSSLEPKQRELFESCVGLFDGVTSASAIIYLADTTRTKLQKLVKALDQSLVTVIAAQ